MKDYGTATSSTTPFLIPARKSSESVNPMNIEEHASPSITPAAAPLVELDRKKLTESMVIDDEIAYSPVADDHFKLIIPFDNNNVPTSDTYLKTKDFNYTMQLMDD